MTILLFSVHGGWLITTLNQAKFKWLLCNNIKLSISFRTAEKHLSSWMLWGTLFKQCSASLIRIHKQEWQGNYPHWNFCALLCSYGIWKHANIYTYVHTSTHILKLNKFPMKWKVSLLKNRNTTYLMQYTFHIALVCVNECCCEGKRSLMWYSFAWLCLDVAELVAINSVMQVLVSMFLLLMFFGGCLKDCSLLFYLEFVHVGEKVWIWILGETVRQMFCPNEDLVCWFSGASWYCDTNEFIVALVCKILLMLLLTLCQCNMTGYLIVTYAGI